MTLLKAFGMRVSDLRILGPQHVRSGLLCFKTVKTGVLCELTISPEARAVIEQTNGLVFLTNDWGRAFASDKALSQRIAKWFRQAGVEGITAHSVRKWRATKMAEGGATEYELTAWFGWKDAKEARPYVQSANRRSLAESAGRRMQSVTRG
jgi:integrase